MGALGAVGALAEGTEAERYDADFRDIEGVTSTAAVSSGSDSATSGSWRWEH